VPSDFPILRGDRVLLRLADPGDVPAIVRFFRENEDFFAPTSPPRPEAFLTDAYHLTQVEEARKEFANDQALRLLVLLQSDGSLIGRANFTRFTRGAFQACNLGYHQALAHQGRGFMTEALRLAIGYVFTELGMHRIEANHLPDNHRSASLLARLGFTREGYAKEYLRIAGRWQDHVLNSLTNPAWKSPAVEPDHPPGMRL
jgi:ribosomal-protein-alanine N-acetyltransferase